MDAGEAEGRWEERNGGEFDKSIEMSTFAVGETGKGTHRGISVLCET
jgi:hypothetical protein